MFGLTAAWLLAPSAACGQPGLQFEVASVRLNPLTGRPHGPTASISGGPGTPDPTHLRYVQVSMMTILAHAFLAQEDQFECPAWIKGTAPDRFDITANVPAGTTPEQVNFMMQNLLKERFHMVYHHGTKEFDAYELAIARGGPKLESAEEPSQAAQASKARRLQPTDKDGFPVLPTGRPGAQGRYSGGGATIFSVKDLDGFTLAPATAVGSRPGADRGVARFSFQMVTTGELLAVVQRLAGIVHAVDHTGLTGTYNAKLMFSGAGPGAVDNAGEPAPDIFSALERQLGLKLRKTKATLDVIVIDHIDRTPEEN